MGQGRTGPMRPQFAGDSPRSLQDAGDTKAAAARASRPVGPPAVVPSALMPFVPSVVSPLTSVLSVAFP